MLQVAAYCRVSTDKEDQANSFEAQQRYFREYIQRQPDWELQGIYADDGFSGTSTNKRVEFNKMLHAAELGQIDLIVSKEVSRFTRNTVDALQITRELRRRGVGVLFLNDSLDTRTNDGELRLTIMSSFAPEAVDGQLAGEGATAKKTSLVPTLILVAVLVVATPLGLLATGDAWGEWDAEGAATAVQEAGDDSLQASVGLDAPTFADALPTGD